MMWCFQTWASLLVIAVFQIPQINASSKAPDPIYYVSNLDNPLISTPSHRVHHLSHFDVTFTLHEGKQRLKLTLEPNHDILADDAHIQYLDAQGNIKHSEPINRADHRVFKGSAWVEESPRVWTRVGWARIYVMRDGPRPLFEGAFSVMHDEHHIQLRSSYIQTRRTSDIDVADRGDDYMVVHRDSDRIPPDRSELKRSSGPSSCEADKLSFNSDPNHPVLRGDPPQEWGAMSLNSLFGLSKRQSDTGGVSGNSGGVNLKSTIGSTVGCPTSKKVALIGVATDCSFVASFNSTESARENVIGVVNTASDVYERTFNISLGLKNLTMSEASCPNSAPTAAPWNLPCSTSNITSRLDIFSTWRRSQTDTNAYWTLMSNCPTADEVGLSWLGQLCVTNVNGAADDVTGANIVIRTSTQWQVFAHESGHTFGAVHDCTSDTCAQGLDSTSQCCPLSSSTCDANSQYIMNPSTADGISQFSPCTVGNICSALGRNSVNSSCLVNNGGIVTITGSQCGNGIVESGEECDCGGTQGCGTDACCDGSTCKFKNGAVCDDMNEECCSGCKFAPSNKVCRASTGSCDLEEKCDGTSGVCPADQYLPNGQSCNSGNTTGLICASGQCTSRDLQCRELMGTLLNTNDTYACDSSSCSLVCASSQLPANTCASMNQNFLDGTPCDGGGSCRNGQCVGSSVGNEIKSWIDDHKTLVIAVASALGGLFILMLLACVVRQCRNRRHPKRKSRGYNSGVPVFSTQHGRQMWPGYYGPGPHPPPYQPAPPPPYENNNNWSGVQYR